MKEEHSAERLEYQSGEREKQAARGSYTPRPRAQRIFAWALIAVVAFGILGMCYWQIFGKF